MRAESCERPESDRRQEEKCVGEPGLATNRERERKREGATRLTGQKRD